MRIKKATDIAKPGEKAVALGGDDFLARANQVIDNFKKLLEMAGKVQGLNLPNIQSSNPPGNQAVVSYRQLNQGKAEPGSFGLKEIVASLMAAGKGDVPIGELIKEISPFTLNQLLAIAQSKGVKRAKSGK